MSEQSGREGGYDDYEPVYKSALSFSALPLKGLRHIVKEVRAEYSRRTAIGKLFLALETLLIAGGVAVASPWAVATIVISLSLGAISYAIHLLNRLGDIVDEWFKQAAMGAAEVLVPVTVSAWKWYREVAYKDIEDNDDVA